MENNRKLPIGIQNFEDLRTNGYLYVDKTAHVYRMATLGKPYFLGRPRRFGKSLLLSTLKAYFLGKKELFEGLAIAQLEKDWVEHPVFHLDFNIGNYANGLPELQSVLNTTLSRLEEAWGRNADEALPPARFAGLIRRAHERTGRKVVVLIDEYDKPLLGKMDDLRPTDEVRSELKSFYSVLKSSDEHLRFVLLTGVTKFSKVSIFSDLNHLMDISMNEAFAGVCGITEQELVGSFQPELRALAAKQGMTYEETLTAMRKRYNGYHFAKVSEGVYNPFSVLSTFSSLDFAGYWFQTGTPTFLVKWLRQVDFDLRRLSGDVLATPDDITDYRVDSGDPIPILYQSGYLTIKGYDKETGFYVLGFPNEEVEYGFLKDLVPACIAHPEQKSEFYAGKFIGELIRGDVDGFMARLRAFFADMPYELSDKTERHYQTMFYLVFKLMGQLVQAEHRSARGRADAVVVVRGTVYVFEFKLAESATAEDALRQIDEKGYLIPFTAGERKVVKVGAEFSAAERTLSRWVVA